MKVKYLPPQNTTCCSSDKLYVGQTDLQSPLESRKQHRHHTRQTTVICVRQLYHLRQSWTPANIHIYHLRSFTEAMEIIKTSRNFDRENWYPCTRNSSSASPHSFVFSYPYGVFSLHRVTVNFWFVVPKWDLYSIGAPFIVLLKTREYDDCTHKILKDHLNTTWLSHEKTIYA